ncbi:uncharacterized protein LOC127443496 [Myxocyprinus asiaticus]|uniref:uncharacterized protein LOC127443496 n=1 Tax=Myxocyprinus asiaticus TaxID=70543 RepID=UPI002221D110|nr:uncharacterized protein LOC127443496 [Myxocyprinus asiaticus]
MIWRCFICYIFVALTLKKLLSHINSLHSRSPDFRVVCGIDGCLSEYRVYNSYYYHVKRTHAHHLLQVEGAEEEGSTRHGSPGTRERTATNNQTNVSLVAEVCAMQQHSSEAEVGSSIVTQTSGFQEGGEGRVNVDLFKHATAFLLQARETHRMTQRAVNQMVSGVQQYQAALLQHLKHQMSNMIETYSGDLDQLKSDAMGIFDQFTDPFSQIATTHLQDKTIKELLQPIEPELIISKNTVCYVKSGDSRVLTIKNHYFYYIPLVKSLEQLLFHPRILAVIEEGPQPCKNGFFHDLVDGDIFKSHPLFLKVPTALQLILYTDEIELCNPLGSRANKNKLLLIYYTLGNIKPKYRSRLAAIRLLAMVKSKDLSDCGIDKIFERINRDLIELYDGVKVVTANGEKTICGALMSVCGDTLAQHEVAGFKEGVGFAYSKCRHCECNFEDMQEQFNEDLFVKRTMASHIRQCSDIEKASTDFLKENLKTTYGINRRSKLTEFPQFDVINQTPQDIMHVILEGVAPYEIKCVLKYLVLSGHMELDTFNCAIIGFPYSPVDARDKPCPISVNTLSSNDNKLKQSAGQMLVLLKILPFLIDTIEENDYTQMLLKLLEIVKILFSPIIALPTLSRLKLLIEQHLKDFKQLFPDTNIIPKQHYLLHLPSQIKALGPMVRHMCMRFESKHCFFKQWALKSSFKNICKSLVKHNQLYECSQNVHEKHPIFSSEVEMGPVSEVKNVHYVEGKMKDFLGIEQVQHVVSVKWIMQHGNKYTCEKTLVISNVINSTPEFGLVKNIYIVNSSVYCFECQPLSITEWNDHYLAYEVEVPYLAQANIFVDAEKLVDYTPYYYLTFNNGKYIPMKYDLTDINEHHSL